MWYNEGIGPVVSHTLITECSMLGRCSDRQIAAYSGTAPLNCDSGQMRGHRWIWSGNGRIRRVLDKKDSCFGLTLGCYVVSFQATKACRNI